MQVDRAGVGRAMPGRGEFRQAENQRTAAQHTAHIEPRGAAAPDDLLPLLRAAIDAAGRKRVALALGVPPWRVETWLKPSRPDARMPAAVLCALLWRDDVLGRGARVALLREVCAAAGALAVMYGDAATERRSDGATKGEGMPGLVLRAAEELGELAGRVRESEVDGRLTAGELAAIEKEAGEVAAQALAVCAAARGKLNGLTSARRGR